MCQRLRSISFLLLTLFVFMPRGSPHIMPFIGIQQRERKREEKKKAATNILWKKPNKYHLYSLMWISRCSRQRCQMAAPPFIPRSPPPLPSLCGSVPFPVRFKRRTVRSVRRFSCRSTAAFDSVDCVDAGEDKKTQ